MVAHPLNLVTAHENSHHPEFELLEKFYEILIDSDLPRRAGNFSKMPEIRTLTEAIARAILPHLEKEEKDLYPFLTSHVPKLEAVIRYLVSEHHDFRETLRTIHLLLDDLGETSSGLIDREKLILKLQQRGTYLYFLFRNHLREEREGLFQVMEETLKPEEKSKVLELL